MFLLAIPFIAVVIFLLAVNFVRFSKEERKEKRGIRIFMFFTRTLIILLVCAALTVPFFTIKSQSDGNPTIMLLIDNSSSMELIDVDIEGLKSSLGEQVPLTVDYIGYGTSSKLSDNIFRYLHKDNLLLITDGNNEEDAMSFTDVVALATNYNTTINSIKIDDELEDVSVSISGPRSAIVDTDYHYSILLDNGHDPVDIKLYIDGALVYEETTEVDDISLTYEFGSLGYHKFEVQIVPSVDDYFDLNNVYYKVVEVVDKPPLLYYAHQESILEDLLPLRYAVTKTAEFPSTDSELSEYFAIVLNNNMNTITEDQSILLETYTDDGNGLVVWGGQNSFTTTSNIDLLLPVKSGDPDESSSVYNFIFLIDSSGYIDKSITDEEEIAFGLIDILDERKETINVGVLDFSFDSFEIHELTHVDNSALVKAAMMNYQDISEIEGVVWYRPADLHKGLQKAQEVFEGVEGNNNIIVISDGAIRENVLDKSFNELRVLRDRGIRVHSYAFMNDRLDETVLKEVRKQISSMGRGLYLTRADDLNLLFEKKLVVSDYNHFITSNLEISAVVTGFNKVIPTPSARTLITTGTGVPIVTINSFNKVCTITTDDGEEWAADMFKDDNLMALYRIIDWAVGDPNRKKDEYTQISDTTVNKETKVEFKGSSKPFSSMCNFIERDEYYECTYVPKDSGFDEILGVPFAVNYEEEYLNIGYNEQMLEYLTRETGGLMFPADNIDAIITKAKSDARLDVLQKYNLDWWLLGAALLVYLLEVTIRRIRQNRGNK